MRGKQIHVSAIFIALLLRLQSQGPLTAQALADAVRVDRSRVSRGFTALGAPIVRLGVQQKQQLTYPAARNQQRKNHESFRTGSGL